MKRRKAEEKAMEKDAGPVSAAELNDEKRSSVDKEVDRNNAANSESMANVDEKSSPSRSEVRPVESV